MSRRAGVKRDPPHGRASSAWGLDRGLGFRQDENEGVHTLLLVLLLLRLLRKVPGRAKSALFFFLWVKIPKERLYGPPLLFTLE